MNKIIEKPNMIKAKVTKTRTGVFVLCYQGSQCFFWCLKESEMQNKLTELKLDSEEVIWVEDFLRGDISQRGAVKEKAYIVKS